jgi:hypothetical protein
MKMFELLFPPRRASSMVRVVRATNGQMIPIQQWRVEEQARLAALAASARIPVGSGQNYDLTFRVPAGAKETYDFSQRRPASQKAEYDFTF